MGLTFDISRGRFVLGIQGVELLIGPSSVETLV
jgi:hypothetical protein